jgi:DNA polymerase-3 subunit epsilon
VVTLSLALAGVAVAVGGAVGFFVAAPPAGEGLSLSQGVIGLLALCAVGALWSLHGTLAHHFDDLERLRAGVLVASANSAGRLPPSRNQAEEAARADEAARLRSAVEALIARRLYPSATVDERLQAVLTAIDEAIVVITTQGQISLVNTAAKAVLGRTRAVIGGSIFAALERDMLVAAIAQVEQSKAPLNWTLYDVEGIAYPAKLAPLTGHSGVVLRLALDDLVLAAPLPRPAAPAPEKGGNVVCLTSHRQARTEAPAPLQPMSLRQPGQIEHDFSLHDELPMVVMGPETPLDDLPVLVFDAESTGLDVKKDRMVQMGGVRVHGGRVFQVATIDRLINPGRGIPAASTAIHGIGDLMVAHAPPFDAVWPCLEPLLRGAVLVGHNIGFDLALLQRECALAEIPFVPPPTLDTLLLAGLLLPDIGQLSLENVAATLGVDVHGRHTALGDALVTSEVYVRMIPLLQANGIYTYADAFAFTRRATHLLARQRAMGW